MLRSGFRIGKLFGIDIRIDWSWLFILFLVTWNLAAVFGQLHSAWGPVLQWGISLFAALLFFASVLAHELAHSLVARAQGVPVRNITLFLFGGVSNIQREPASPGNEFLMAIVGPLTSIVLGGLLTLIAAVTSVPLEQTVSDPAAAIAQLSPFTFLVAWLGSINVLVGLFNLIPGFPLDGGRVLRSLLWAITKNLRRATRWASWVGQGIAALMMVGGVAMIFGVEIPFFGTGFVGGLWLAFIGWFLNSASAQSYQHIVVHDILEGVPASHIMRQNPPSVASNSSVSSLVHDHVMGTDDHAFPVLDEGRLVGIVTLEDIRKAPQDAWGTMTVAQIMTPAAQLVTVAAQEDAAEALNKMMQRGVRQLPVIYEGSMVGLLRQKDILKWLQLHAETASS
jgi:Zn-dependent protease/predicted transcriptional regulator